MTIDIHCILVVDCYCYKWRLYILQVSTVVYILAPLQVKRILSKTFCKFDAYLFVFHESRTFYSFFIFNLKAELIIIIFFYIIYVEYFIYFTGYSRTNLFPLMLFIIIFLAEQIIFPFYIF